jgi:hypothetical protein
MLVNLAVLAVLLVAAEFAYRWLYPEMRAAVRTFAGQHANRTNWARPDPDLGWVFSGSGYRTFLRPDKQWVATVNRQGFRSSFDYESRGAKGAVKRVMVLGDSYAFGIYLNDSDTFCALLQERLGSAYEVYSFAIPGWGIDQMYLAYVKYGRLVDPDVVTAVYIDDDVNRVFDAYRWVEGLNKPSFKLDRGRLVRRTGDSPGLLEAVAARSLMANQLYNWLHRVPTSVAISRALFAQLADETSQQGQRLVAVRYPGKREITLRNRPYPYDISDVFKERGVLHLDPAADMQAAGPAAAAGFYFDDDAHPTREGNAFVVRYVAQRAFARE